MWSFLGHRLGLVALGLMLPGLLALGIPLQALGAFAAGALSGLVFAGLPILLVAWALGLAEIGQVLALPLWMGRLALTLVRRPRL